MSAKPNLATASAAGRLSLEAQKDASLVGLAQTGDDAACRALYDRWRPMLLRAARAFAQLDRDDVEDVVQDAFVRAFRRLDRLREPARFGPWILIIARNCALSRLARGRIIAELAGDLARETEIWSEERAALPDPAPEAEVELVRRLIGELPEGQEKETVRLFYLEGKLSAREIAERLGVGKSAITMRLERFRSRVKRRMLAEVAKLRGEES